MTEREADDGRIRVNRSKIDSLDVHEITDDELVQLEHGGVTQTIFSFAIATGSFGASSVLALINLKSESDLEFLSFFCVSIISLLASVILFVVWSKLRQSRADVVTRIRDRGAAKEDISSDPTVIET